MDLQMPEPAPLRSAEGTHRAALEPEAQTAGQICISGSVLPLGSHINIFIFR
jgi:hypothetical protein